MFISQFDFNNIDILVKIIYVISFTLIYLIGSVTVFNSVYGRISRSELSDTAKMIYYIIFFFPWFLIINLYDRIIITVWGYPYYIVVIVVALSLLYIYLLYKLSDIIEIYLYSKLSNYKSMSRFSSSNWVVKITFIAIVYIITVYMVSLFL